jgi:hypothetical protein
VGHTKYVLSFTDDAARMTEIYPFKTKTAPEVLEKFKEFQTQVEAKYKIRWLRTDGGTEYKGVFAGYLKENAIKHEVSAPYTPAQNGVAERVKRTITCRGENWMVVVSK